MKTILRFALLSMFAVPAYAQVPLCNTFDANGVPVYSNGTTTTPNCTDLFGVANWANSPLPVGQVDISATGFTIVNGGSGYTAPAVTITDFYGLGDGMAGGCTAAVTGGVITGIACTSAGTGYMAPVVDITDATGNGAVILAKLDASAALSGGMQKFMDALPDLNKTIPTADTTIFPNSDFYIIGLVQYQAQMHADLPRTTIRGYCQLASATATTCSTAPSYLGPTILAQKSRPVRVLFRNLLPAGSGGNLFIPADPTYMGAGVGPDGVNKYLENRATLHLHGGATPWISDGTPHQWTVPVGETNTTYKKGVSTANVPDMWFDGSGNLITSCAGKTTCSTTGATNNPGPGAMTFYWTNQQGGRLMFYHDHAYGITRLNVYVGEAAGYLLYDPIEEAALLTANAGVPGIIATNATTKLPDLANSDTTHLIPLVIQDKTFVPGAAQLAATDPTWTFTPGGGSGAAPLTPGAPNGDFWFPHVYPPNQNPNDTLGGANAFGRWDYGPWFFPPQNSLSAANPATAVTVPCTSSAFPGQTLAPSTTDPVGGCPIIPNPSGTPEGFMDTPVVNGKAYPVLHVAPEAYRFKILSVGNDRSFNLSIYQSCLNTTNFSTAGQTYCTAMGAAAAKEVPMVPAVQGGPGTTGYVWPDQLDGRSGGVPDINAAGPSWVQIGTEGGLLPGAVVIPPTPVGYEYNRRSITVTNVSSHGLLLGPAERADVIVDFSQYAGKTLILYNDSPAPIPAFDSRIDYFTGDPDQVQTGGAPTTLPGYGPNTRTVMQIVVDLPATAPALNVASVESALPGIFKQTQPVPIVPEPTYPVASGGNSGTATYGRIQDNTITYTPVGSTNPTTYTYDQKAIQELFTLDYGRMNATLGVELPFTNFITQTTIPYGYVDWPTELLQDGQTQIWKLTHNGVDTHFMHFHLFNVQVINRIGWDGAVKPPDPDELGWKETVRMNPLEDIVFALQPVKPNLPWPIPDSIRPMDVTMNTGMADSQISGLNPVDGNATITNVNATVNFGWEYVWHCHILGHEENDMMRPIIFEAPPPAPSNLTATAASGKFAVNLSWVDNSASETGFTIQRAGDSLFTTGLATFTTGPSVPNTAFGGTRTFSDTTAKKGSLYFYRVQAFDNFAPASPLPAPWAPLTLASAWSATYQFGSPPPPAPIATVNPTSLSFGLVTLGVTSQAKTVTLSNTGNATLSIGSIGISGSAAGDFAIASKTCGTSLAAGTNCTINVTFKPTRRNSRSANLVFTDNSGGVTGSTQTVALSGTGQ